MGWFSGFYSWTWFQRETFGISSGPIFWTKRGTKRCRKDLPCASSAFFFGGSPNGDFDSQEPSLQWWYFGDDFEKSQQQFDGNKVNEIVTCLRQNRHFEGLCWGYSLWSSRLWCFLEAGLDSEKGVNQTRRPKDIFIFYVQKTEAMIVSKRISSGFWYCGCDDQKILSLFPILRKHQGTKAQRLTTTIPQQISLSCTLYIYIYRYRYRYIAG